MYYTETAPTDDVDRVYLFPSVDAVKAVSRGARTIYEVAVDFDVRRRRVIPLQVYLPVVEPEWMPPAEARADGSIIAKGSIPQPLFIGCITPANWESCGDEVAPRLSFQRPSGVV